MKKFAHFNASTIEEAVELLKRYGGRANLIAGGTDLLGKMKDRILPNYPEALINLKTIPGLDFIKEEKGLLKIGALTRLEDIATSETVKEQYTALAKATHRTASPHLREMGTIGGNLCQDIRCWYYRNADNRFPCLRKGGGRCYAHAGDTRYHSIFGGSVEEGCIAVHPSDNAPALMALKARVRTSKRTIEMEDFFQVGVIKTTVLDDDEIVAEIQIPTPPTGSKSSFYKFALRKSIDFPIVNCAAHINTSEGQVRDALICLNAVYVKPYRAKKAEEVLIGGEINETTAAEAGLAAVIEAAPLKDNKYMVEIAKVLVKRAILDCR
ncbi:MAG: FAD binding domain-containing protein [Deltaproteobacteria bacterium]|nr:FAD binding domain-containing protein [Deltaproteobacteria bacterium]